MPTLLFMLWCDRQFPDTRDYHDSNPQIVRPRTNNQWFERRSISVELRRPLGHRRRAKGVQPLAPSLAPPVSPQRTDAQAYARRATDADGDSDEGGEYPRGQPGRWFDERAQVDDERSAALRDSSPRAQAGGEGARQGAGQRAGRRGRDRDRNRWRVRPFRRSRDHGLQTTPGSERARRYARPCGL